MHQSLKRELVEQLWILGELDRIQREWKSLDIVQRSFNIQMFACLLGSQQSTISENPSYFVSSA